MNKTVIFILTCAVSAAVALPARAHHSAAAYNTQEEVKVTGTISEYKFRNPHIYMTLQVKNADGSNSALEVEAGAASVLGPLGFTRDSVALGDVVTISGNPARNSADKLMLGKDLYKRYGTYYPLNIASRSIYTAKNEVATSIAGTWFSPRTEFNSFLGGARNWGVTDEQNAEGHALPKRVDWIFYSAAQSTIITFAVSALVATVFAPAAADWRLIPASDRAAARICGLVWRSPSSTA